MTEDIRVPRPVIMLDIPHDTKNSYQTGYGLGMALIKTATVFMWEFGAAVCKHSPKEPTLVMSLLSIV